MSTQRAAEICPDCARRSWLIARLAGHLEHHRARREAVRDALGLSDRRLIAALAGADSGTVRAEHAAIDGTALIERWAALGSEAVCRHADAYPAALHELGDAPAALFLHGQRERLDELLRSPAVAIVGARKASPEGREIARGLARGLSAAGVTVVSGMALGIDAAAHEGAFDAGARTLAVLACGPEIAYPRARRELHGRLAASAAVVSELPPGTTPWRWAFPARNRIIAALAQTTVVVEAAERSGSLITADIALGLGRDVAAVPGSPSSWRCSGTNQLLRDGATLVRDAVDVLDGLAGRPLATPDEAIESDRAAAPPAGLAPELRDLLLAIDAGADTADDHAATPEAARRALGDLTSLELLGLVRRTPGGRYVRTTR